MVIIDIVNRLYISSSEFKNTGPDIQDINFFQQARTPMKHLVTAFIQVQYSFCCFKNHKVYHLQIFVDSVFCLRSSLLSS